MKIILQLCLYSLFFAMPSMYALSDTTNIREEQNKELLNSLYMMAYMYYKYEVGYTNAQLIKQLEASIMHHQLMQNDCKATESIVADTLQRIKKETLAIKPNIAENHLADIIDLNATCDSINQIDERALNGMRDFVAFVKSR